MALCVPRSDLLNKLPQRLEWEEGTSRDNYITLPIAIIIYWFSDRGILDNSSLSSMYQNTQSLLQFTLRDCGNDLQLWMLRLEIQQGHDSEKRALAYFTNKAEKKNKLILKRTIRQHFLQNHFLTAMMGRGTDPDTSGKDCSRDGLFIFTALTSVLELRIILFCYLVLF